VSSNKASVPSISALTGFQFYHGGFARDYQWTAHALGMRHFAVQHDKYFTAPNEPKVNYPEGFQGSKITVVGKVVADIIEERLAMRI